MQSVVGQGLLPLLGVAGDNAAQAGAGLEQGGGLTLITSMYSASLVSGLCTFSSCKTSPSAIRLVAWERISMTRISPTPTIISKVRE